VVKDELVGEWQAQLPDDIPNYFLINIRSDDVAGSRNFYTSARLKLRRPMRWCAPAWARSMRSMLIKSGFHIHAGPIV